MTKKTCFVICPIGKEKSETRKKADQFLKYIVKKVFSEIQEEFEIIRADQISEPGSITSQIIEKLINADLVIADLTDFNPNVFYELGIRHSFQKPFIQIYNPVQRLPFDIQGLRSIPLDRTDLDSIENCKEELKKQIEVILRNPEKVISPVTSSINIQKLKESGSQTDSVLATIMEKLEWIDTKISTTTPFIPGKDVFPKWPRTYSERIDQKGISQEDVEILKSIFEENPYLEFEGINDLAFYFDYPILQNILLDLAKTRNINENKIANIRFRGMDEEIYIFFKV
ncbi:MAG: hypothetical protein ACFE9L_17245 [Candidatus Hodarchaeota archaeon]